MDELKVMDPQESARRIEAIFSGTFKGACLESILINAGAAFMALDPTTDIREGVLKASRVITSGDALQALQRARQ